ncbi:8-oxo-dGTP pyrophosphatase MutT (NUDIX family) [Microbacterium endophyticum]|uniref:8-oxo-dGTP pyrophosphatase MutT (NUDIX family) n=1 Tax=Microbacterium endophyticum TaxID=1526412 RepID=A0A7W4YND5_9MICO|nr:NUDIX hydrolase [Microbacterium endophyticum]MBB2976057.1 8-oxo-dGTP pyrophosphatase MutT (NUDIX family) [Microbacterium endophyticum]NIK35024.1 8-oxo-dGTP pyrophosphatase MutT (NUDIX family) [Microbacterium endophyticum]
MTWQTQSTRVVYENRWIRVREDTVQGPHGIGIYGVLEMQHPAVFIVAVNDDDRVCLLTLDRYPTGGRSSEVPAGGSDGESPLIAAQRELLEETGYEAADWTSLGIMNALNGIANAPEHVFLARELTQIRDATSTQDEEGIDLVEWVPFSEVLARVADGRITDGETIAALTYAGIHLGRFT